MASTLELPREEASTSRRPHVLRPQILAEASSTGKRPFHTARVLKALQDEFVGRRETLRQLLEMLRAVQTMFLFGRCSDKLRIVRSTCRAARMLVVEVDCNLVETVQQLFEYLLSRIDIAVDDAKRIRKRKRAAAAVAAAARSSLLGSGQDSIAHSIGIGRADTAPPKKLGRRSGATVVEKVYRKRVEKCSRISDFIKKIHSALRRRHARPYRGKLIALIFSNAAALGLLDRSIIEVLSKKLPERVRVIFLSDAPKLAFSRVGCPTLHIPYLTQSDFIATVCREYERDSAWRSAALSQIRYDGTRSSLRHHSPQERKSSLKQHFQYFTKQLCLILQSRNALRDTDELRYFLLTWWPSFATIARTMNFDDFVLFLRAALQQPRLLGAARDHLFAHDTRPPRFILHSASSAQESVEGGSSTNERERSIAIPFTFASTQEEASQADTRNKASAHGDAGTVDAAENTKRRMRRCTAVLPQREISLDFPTVMKFVLIAAYLCSHISEKEDERLFSPKDSRDKNRRVRAKPAYDNGSGMSRGDAETANTFGIERLVAVCHSIMSSHDGVARHIDPGELLSQVAVLEQMRLVDRKSGPQQLHEPKFRALFDRELLDAVAQTIRDSRGQPFDVGHYIAVSKRYQ